MITLILLLTLNTDTLFVARLNDIRYTSKYSTETQFLWIQFEDGETMHIGQKMQIGAPKPNRLTKDGRFSYLSLGRKTHYLFYDTYFLPEYYRGRELRIENIKLLKSKIQGIPSTASIIMDNPENLDVTVLDLKYALKYGEINR